MSDWRARVRAMVADAYPGDVRAGDVFAAVESLIPIHTAFRMARSIRHDPSSPPAARWVAFMMAVRVAPIERGVVPLVPHSRLRIIPCWCGACNAPVVPTPAHRQKVHYCIRCRGMRHVKAARRARP